MTRIWLIRHSATASAPGVAIGAGDPPLSAEGLVQARRLAIALASRPLIQVLSSDRIRALATAHIVARPHLLPVEASADLREIDFGAWEGRALGELWGEEPHAAKAWEADIRSTPPSFGEGFPDLERRVGRFWASLQPLPERGEVAIVAHRGSLAVLRAAITGEPAAQAFAAALEPAGVVSLIAG